MDYLDLPGSGEEHMQVPFVATLPLPYDCAFKQFPERCGFRHDGVFALDLHPAEVADFAQSWLFFGLLSALMGQEIDIYDFKSPVDRTGEHNVALGRLRHFIRSARVQYAALQIPADVHETDRADLEADLSTLMSTVSATHPRYSDDPSRDDTQSSEDLELMSSGSSALPRYDLRNERGRGRVPVHSDKVRFRAIQTALEGIEALERRYGDIANRPLERVLLSIRVLISFFEVTERTERTVLSSDLQNPAVGARVIRDLMRANKWCSSQWHQVCRTHGYVNAYLLSCISKRIGPERDHSRCQEVSCRAWSSGAPAQTPKHRDLLCTCVETGVSTDALCSMIERGQIPLISISVDDEGSPTVSLQGWNGWTPYIAISHIWADGMCNPKANTLPACQLSYLQRIVQEGTRQDSGTISKLVERVSGGSKALFWLDTLCIPPQPPASDANAERYKVMKGRAIDSMNVIYANAASTIVLDSAIQTLSKSLEPAVLLAHICYNGWMTRAWTLQEGGLPIRLLFAVSDGLFNPFEQAALVRRELESRATRLTREKVIKRWVRWKRNQTWVSHERYRDILQDISWNEGSAFRLHNKLCYSLLDFRQQCHRVRPDRTTYGEMMLPMWNALIRRDSSFKQDLPYILANLLGFKTSEIRDHPELRIAKIIGSLDCIPFGFLCNTGPKLGPVASIDGATVGAADSTPNPSSENMSARFWDMINRWIPRELDGTLIPPGPLLEPTENALKLSASACTGSETTAGCSVCVIYQPGPSLEAFVLTCPDWPGRQLLIQGSRQEGDHVTLPAIEARARGYCLLLEQKEAGLQPQDDEILRGALLAILDEDRSGVIKTVYHSPIRALQLPTSHGWQQAAGLDMAAVVADRAGPENLEIAYNPKKLGKIQGRTTELRLERNYFANRASYIFTGVNLFAAITLASLNIKYADSKAKNARTVVSVITLVLEPTVLVLPIFFRSWLLRRRIVYLFSSETSFTAGELVRRNLISASDYIVNSAMARALVLTSLTSLLIIVSLYTASSSKSVLAVIVIFSITWIPFKLVWRFPQMKASWKKALDLKMKRKHWSTSS